MDERVQNEGEHEANYDAGYQGEEELQIPLLYKYVSGKLS